MQFAYATSHFLNEEKSRVVKLRERVTFNVNLIVVQRYRWAYAASTQHVMIIS